MSSKIKVLRVIPKLGYGGVETGCYDLAHYLPEKNCASYIVTSGGKLLKYVRDGDTIVVWKLDRLARSLIHFTNLMTRLKEKGVRFRSITEPFIDTTEKSSHSEFIINIFAALAQLERDIIIERTKAGLESARRRGKILGAPKGLSKKNQQKAVLCEEYFNNGVLTVTEICERLNISRATYYKYLRHRGLSGKLRSYKR